MSIQKENVSKILERQTSSPLLQRPTKNNSINFRSKTPPPKFKYNSGNSVKENIQKKTTISKNVPSTCKILRNRGPKVTKSSEEIALNFPKQPVKCYKEMLTKEEFLDIKYNAYLQNCLMIAHSRNVRKRNKTKILKEIEELHIKLLTMDEKISALKIDLEKIQFFKQIKENLLKKIKNYEEFINSVNTKQTSEYIKILESDLNIIRSKHLYIPQTEKDANETLNSLKDIADELKLLPIVEKKLLPLTNLHSSLIETKLDIEEEEKLKNLCEKKLRVAEELLYHECFLKSQIQEKIT